LFGCETWTVTLWEEKNESILEDNTEQNIFTWKMGNCQESRKNVANYSVFFTSAWKL